MKTPLIVQTAVHTAYCAYILVTRTQEFISQAKLLLDNQEPDFLSYSSWTYSQGPR